MDRLSVPQDTLTGNCERITITPNPLRRWLVRWWQAEVAEKGVVSI
jgi:hypothetical protein